MASTFAEKLAAAHRARPSKDVKIILDADLASERENLLAEIEALQGREMRLGEVDPADELRGRLEALTDAALDALVVLRFTRLPGREWAALTSKNPVRADVPIDRHYGYNYDAVCEAAAMKSGVRVDGDEELPLTTQEWDELFGALSGNEVGEIRDAVWALNEWEPQQRIQALVKASGAATRSDSK